MVRQLSTVGTGTHARDDRGISEVVGFVLSFSIIILAVGLMFSGGTTSLLDIRGDQQTQNAEQVFLAIADGFSELEEGQAPKRAGSLDLDVGASLSVANESQITVRVNGPGYERTFNTRSLNYNYERTIVSYQNGAVIRSDRGAAVMVGKPPELYCSDSSRVAVVSIVTLVAPNTSSVGGSTVTVTGIQLSSKLLYPQDRTATSIQNVTLNVSSPYRTAWNEHLGAASTDWVDPDGDGTYACENVDRAFVRHTVVEVRIVR